MVQKPQSAIKMLSRSVSVISAAPTRLLKLFIHSKTLYYDVTPFMYYVMVGNNLCGHPPLITDRFD